MFIKRSEYESLRERALKAEMRVEVLDGDKAILVERVYARTLRIKELEAALLAAHDAAYKVRQTERPPSSNIIPVNLASLFDDEDPDLVEQDRRQAALEGSTDTLLATME